MPGEPHIDFFGPSFYVPSINGTKNPRFFIRTGTIRDLQFETPSLERGQELARKYLRFQPDLIEEVDEFWQGQDLRGRVLGVHYRGTDKAGEAPRVGYATTLGAAREYLDAHADTRAIFVTSDEQKFIDLAQKSLDGIRVVSREDFRRATASTEVHHDLDAILPIQRDAAVNMLLLARCTSLIKTASFLSAFAALLNPELEVTILNRPHADYTWFPERELLEIQDNTADGRFRHGHL